VGELETIKDLKLIDFKVSRLEDSQMAVNRRIYKSLAIVMSVIFFLYLMGAFGTLFIPMLTNDPQMSFVYFHLCVQLIALAGAINAPVLYICRSKYKFNRSKKKFQHY
jgi:hypothetical protein